jgi:tight adherence protein C
VIADLERRCPAAGIAALCAALRRADRHGAPLAPTLAALAEQARARAAQRTLEGAARAAPQIQLVVALLLVPAVLLLVAAALLPALTGGAV